MDTVIRVALVYLVLFVALRIMGKREFGQLSPFELITLLLIPEILTEALSRGDSSLTHAFVGVSTLLALVFVTSAATYRFPRVGRLTEGEPTVVVRHGAFILPAMHRERVSPEEVLSEMHRAGLERLEQVKWGVVETDGKISFVRRDGLAHQPREATALGST